MQCLACQKAIDEPKPYESDMGLCAVCLGIGKIRRGYLHKDQRAGPTFISDIRRVEPTKAPDGTWVACYELVRRRYFIDGRQVTREVCHAAVEALSA